MGVRRGGGLAKSKTAAGPWMDKADPQRQGRFWLPCRHPGGACTACPFLSCWSSQIPGLLQTCIKALGCQPAAELPSNRPSLSMDGGGLVGQRWRVALRQGRSDSVLPLKAAGKRVWTGGLAGACMDPCGTLELEFGIASQARSCKCCSRLLKQRTPACAIISGWGAQLNSRAPVGSKRTMLPASCRVRPFFV